MMVLALAVGVLGSKRKEEGRGCAVSCSPSREGGAWGGCCVGGIVLGDKDGGEERMAAVGRWGMEMERLRLVLGFGIREIIKYEVIMGFGYWAWVMVYRIWLDNGFG